MKLRCNFQSNLHFIAKNEGYLSWKTKKTEIISAKYNTAETDHMAYQPGMDNIGSEIQIKIIYSR